MKGFNFFSTLLFLCTFVVAGSAMEQGGSASYAQRPIVIVVNGTSGSGKSAITKAVYERFLDKTKWKRLSTDVEEDGTDGGDEKFYNGYDPASGLFVENHWLVREAKKLVEQGYNVICDTILDGVLGENNIRTFVEAFGGNRPRAALVFAPLLVSMERAASRRERVTSSPAVVEQMSGIYSPSSEPSNPFGFVSQEEVAGMYERQKVERQDREWMDNILKKRFGLVTGACTPIAPEYEYDKIIFNDRDRELGSCIQEFADWVKALEREAQEPVGFELVSSTDARASGFITPTFPMQTGEAAVPVKKPTPTRPGHGVWRASRDNAMSDGE